MTKREFLKTLGGLALTSLAGAASGGQARRSRNFVWMRPSLTKTPAEWERDFGLMRASGIHGIIPEIYNGRQAFFESRRLPVRAPWLESVIPLAAKAGLEVHGWMWCMPCSIDRVIKEHPDWYNVNAKGEPAWEKPAYVDYYKFLDPARPEVREFIRDTVRELASIAGLTGVHLDYIRHPDAILPSGLWSKYGIVQDKVYPPYDYGYTEYSRRAFKAKTGIDPIQLKDPEANAAWLQYRLDSVVDLVNDYLAPAARAGGKGISAAVFPGPSLARTMVRQDWGRFDLDAYFPMLYHTFYEAGPEFVGKYTAEAVRTVKRPVYSGLFVGPLDASAFTTTVQAALSSGASGVSIFDASAMNAERWALLAKLTSGVFLLAAIVILSLASVAWVSAQAPMTPHPRGYIAHRASMPLRIDGRLDDDGWRTAPWSEPFVDIEGDVKPRPRFETRVKMLWDADYFYVGARLDEPHVWGTLTTHDAVIFHDPDFEIFVDPNGDNHEYYELEINALGTYWDLYLPKPYKDDGKAMNGWEIQGLQSAVVVDGTLNDPRDTDRGWTVELAIPWKVLGEQARRPAPPGEGDQWRVNFSRVQWPFDASGGKYRKPQGAREDNWVWSPQHVVDMHRPETWGYVQFTSRPPGEVTFTPDPSWPARAWLHRAYYAQRDYRRAHGRWAASIDELKIGALPRELDGPELRVAGSLFELSVGLAGTGQRWRIRQDSLFLSGS